MIEDDEDDYLITSEVLEEIRDDRFQLDWVQEQCLEKLGFKPYPGTLNLEISVDDIPIIEALLSDEGIELIPPDSKFCSGYVIAISVSGISGAIVFPAEDVRLHGRNIIEIISPKGLKDTLKVNDGDEITLTIYNLNMPKP